MVNENNKLQPVDDNSHISFAIIWYQCGDISKTYVPFWNKRYEFEKTLKKVWWCQRKNIFLQCFRLNIDTIMIEIKDTLVIKSDSPKVAEWVNRMKAYKAAQLQDMARRSMEICEMAM